jgi:hypothetical protein
MRIQEGTSHKLAPFVNEFSQMHKRGKQFFITKQLFGSEDCDELKRQGSDHKWQIIDFDQVQQSLPGSRRRILRYQQTIYKWTKQNLQKREEDKLIQTVVDAITNNEQETPQEEGDEDVDEEIDESEDEDDTEEDDEDEDDGEGEDEDEDKPLHKEAPTSHSEDFILKYVVTNGGGPPIPVATHKITKENYSDAEQVPHKIYEELIKMITIAHPETTSITFKLLKSSKKCKTQSLHVDDGEFNNHTERKKYSKASFSMLMALEPNGNETSLKMRNLKLKAKRIQRIHQGCIVMWRTDLPHAGSKYKKNNIRLFVAIGTDDFRNDGINVGLFH